ncbi:MAG: hypothetical protein U5K72_15185 [Balneolaceae bacterium]|nr:hypothetical protein [Balneolaceae bacterium]
MSWIKNTGQPSIQYPTISDRIDEALSTQLALGTPTQNPTTGRYEWEASDEEYQVGANTISQRFADASEAIDKFYGNYISYRWRNNKWASDKLTAFSNLRSGSVRDAVIEGNESMLENRLGWSINYQSENSATFSGNSVPGDAVDDIVFIAGKREGFIHGFDPGTSGSDADDLADQFESDMRDFANNDIQSFVLNFIQNGIEFWYEMPTLGYEAIRDSSRAQAERMASTYQNNIKPMETAHEDFTATVDEIYKSKASLTMTLREMIAIYAERRAALAGDSAAVDLNQRKDDLEETLTPPRIGGIQVTRNLTDYNNKITLSWNASHQTGNIVENSYYLGGSGAGSDVYAQGMLSTGSSSDVTRYIFKTTQDVEELNMGVVVRVRGPSGTAISRPASFSAVVDEYGSVSPHPSGVAESIEEEDDSPPSEPIVKVEYNKSETTRFRVSDNYNIESETINVYWTNQAGQIVFQATSLDEDTDIAAFEYALGSSKGATDIVDWTERQGRRVTREASDLLGNMAGADNIIQEITIQDVNLTEGPHYLSVRAVNGVGMTSSAEEMSTPIQYDGDLPTAPAISEDGITMPRIKSGSEFQSNFREAGPATPEYEDPPPKDVETPELTLNWSDASDSTSGVHRYEYAVSSDENSQAAFAKPNEINTSYSSETTIEGDPLSFNQDSYIHIRAVDEAGNSGEASTIGPVTPEDPTRPWTPKIKASAKPGEIGFYLYRPSMDWETEVDRYEFTATEGLFSGDLLPWTEVNTSSANVGLLFYALAADQEKSMNGSDASFIEVPTEEIPEGTSLVLKVRTVNGQGLESETGWSGSVVFDNSPPENPSISLSQNGDEMTIGVSNIRDPESGISKVEYKVSSKNAMSFGAMWSNFITVNGVQESTLSGSITEDISNQSFLDLRVSIRITNGNGMQTTVSQTPTVNDFSDSNQQEYDYDFEF